VPSSLQCGNLLLARAASRSREIAIRTALGASRLRLLRQLLTESTLLALLGGMLGILLTLWVLPILLSLSPPEIGEFNRVALNRQVLAFSVFVSLLTGTLFGLVPALFASRSNPNQALREGERGSSLGKSLARSVLITAEIGLSFVLLVGAGCDKSPLKPTEADPGFVPSFARLQYRASLPPTPRGKFHFTSAGGSKGCREWNRPAQSTGCRWPAGTAPAASTFPAAPSRMMPISGSAPRIIFRQWRFRS
jgi:hypothetical protein